LSSELLIAPKGIEIYIGIAGENFTKLLIAPKGIEIPAIPVIIGIR